MSHIHIEPVKQFPYLIIGRRLVRHSGQAANEQPATLRAIIIPVACGIGPLPPFKGESGRLLLWGHLGLVPSSKKWLLGRLRDTWLDCHRAAQHVFPVQFRHS